MAFLLLQSEVRDEATLKAFEYNLNQVSEVLFTPQGRLLNSAELIGRASFHPT